MKNTPEEYEALVEELKLHNYRYWALNKPILTDLAYDKLYREALETEKKRPSWALPDSPTQRVHNRSNPPGRDMIRRMTPVLSLEKMWEEKDVVEWMERLYNWYGYGGTWYRVEWKYDGVPVVLVYLEGQLVKASYGMGVYGVDCMAHVALMGDVPQEIKRGKRVEVRGELVCLVDKMDWERFPSPRSAAAAYLYEAQPDRELAACMAFYPYDVICDKIDPDYLDLETGEYVDALSELDFEYLEQLGFRHTEHKCIWTREDERHECIGVGTCSVAESMVERMVFDFLYDQDRQPFFSDGIVFKMDAREYWPDAGFTLHHPKCAVAFKFRHLVRSSDVLSVETVKGAKPGHGRKVARIEPVRLGVKLVSEVCLDTDDTWRRYGLSREEDLVGCSVFVTLDDNEVPYISYCNPLPC